MNISSQAIFKFLIALFLLGWYTFFLAQKIDLSTADLGRHLKNGEVFLNNHHSPVLSKNYYSYTYPDFPVINHHWGSGALFYLLWKAAGFGGLSLVYIFLSLAAFFLVFHVAWRFGNPFLAVFFSLLLIPVLAERGEVRPEIFSNFFCALFFSLLWRHREGVLDLKILWILPLFEMIWANTHIYFFLGPALIGMFWIEKMTKRMTAILVASIAACFATPFGWKGILYPLEIFKNYGYRLIENQSVMFLEKVRVIHPDFIYFKWALAFLAAGFTAMFFQRRKDWSWPLFLTACLFSAMACRALRNFALFGLVALPILSAHFRFLWPERIFGRRFLASAFGIFISGALLCSTAAAYGGIFPRRGIGLAEGNAASAEFFKKNGLRGPIFNNYDIGGYLIYHLFPAERVFVDNRPEAYPKEFFSNIYIPAQEDPVKWRALDAQYHFNVIYFAYHDFTPWGQKFLIERLRDPDWAPVYADAYAVIFIRRIFENREIFMQYELPKSDFLVTQL